MKFALLVCTAVAGWMLLSHPTQSADVRSSVTTEPALAISSSRTPTTREELLQNIKLLAESDLLLRDEFFSDATLKSFFNSSRIEWVGANTPGSFALMLALDQRPPGERFSITVYPPDHRDDRGRRDDEHKLSAGIVMVGGVPHIPIEAIESVFGPATEVSDYPGADYVGHPFPLDFKTHKLGNTRIIYRFYKPGVRALVTVVTNGDGTVNGLNVHAERQ